MIEKIISGGQTGVDQAALSVASKMPTLDVGGWCPKGGYDENLVDIRKKYPTLIQTDSEDPAIRTKLNIQDSDGTLIILPKLPLPKNIQDGTILTIEEASRLKKPFIIFCLENEKHHSIDDVIQWIEKNNIKTLNVAGPRESSCPGIYDRTCAILPRFIQTHQFSAKL